MSYRNKGRFGCHGNRVRNAKKAWPPRPRYTESVNYWVRLGEYRIIPMPGGIILVPNNK